MLWLKVHSHRLLRACLLGSKRKLTSPDCQVLLGLHSVACRPRSVQFPGAVSSVIRVHCQVLEHTTFLLHAVLALIAEMLLLPTPVPQTAHGNSHDLSHDPVPQNMIAVFAAFTLSPFFSIASFLVKSILTHSSSDSAMITRSSAQRSSQGTPERISRDKASSKMVKSSRLRTEPW